MVILFEAKARSRTARCGGAQATKRDADMTSSMSARSPPPPAPFAPASVTFAPSWSSLVFVVVDFSASDCAVQVRHSPLQVVYVCAP